MSMERIIAQIEAREDEIINLLGKMISIRSDNPGADIQGPKEAEISAFLKKYCEDLGLETEVIAEDNMGVRGNICAVLKGKNPSKGKPVILNAHMDTVIVSEPEKWQTDPFTATEIDGKIYGRGANDMKGGLCAALSAVKAIKESGVELDSDVILQLVVGEESCEGGTLGTAACIRNGYVAPFAISCEPTSLEIHTSTASLVCFELIVKGKAVHTCCRNQVIFPQAAHQASGAEVGVDAVEKALPFIEFFYRLEKEWNNRWKNRGVGTGGFPNHDKQGIGAFNINPSLIEGGTYIAAVCSNLKVTYCVWHPADINADVILDEIRERVHALAQTDDWLRENPPIVNGPVSQLWPGFITPDDCEPVVMLKKSFQQSLHREPVVSGFRAVCDGTYLVQGGIPTIILGPGAINDGGHGDNEFVARQEILDAAKIYAAFICDWCNG